MLKIPGLNHPDFFHYVFRPNVMCRSKREYFINFQRFKTKLQACPCCLGCKPITPVCFAQPPANLNAGCKVAFEPWMRKAGKTTKLPVIFSLNSKKTKAILFYMTG